MIKLQAGNVLLKPSHRKLLSALLRRPQRLGQRLGDFDLTIRMHRTGRQYEMSAHVHDAAGDFDCRTRQTDLPGALRGLARRLADRLHSQRVRQCAA